MSQNIFQRNSVIVALALLCCILWGSAFPCIKIGYKLFAIEGAGSQILFAGCRFFLSGIIAFIIASIMERKPITIKKSSVPYVLGQGLLQTTIQYVFFYLGLAHTTGSKGSVINASSTFFSIIMAHIILKNEKITWRKALGCLIGFAGVIIINFAPGAFGGGFSLTGEGFIVICSFAYGTSSVTLKLISDREKPATITAYQLLFGGAVLILIGLLTGGHFGAVSAKGLLLLLYMASLTSVSFSLWATLLKYNPVGKVAVFGFSIPIFGVLLSALLLGEQIAGWTTLIALILVSIGILLVNLAPRTTHQGAKAS